MKRDQWNSQLGFLFAAVGSAIGLGNIWRFGYMAYSYGGGAFIIPYLTALLTVGISLLILEFAIGHERVGSAPMAYAKINKNMELFGWWSVTLLMFGIVLYYTVIVAWCLNFFVLSFNLGWGNDPDTFFFNQFLAVADKPSQIGHIRTPIFVALFVVWLINWAILYRGIRKGIELANKIFMPLLFLLTIVLVFWSISLEGSMDGIKEYLRPDFSKLTNPKVWTDAYGQIFFTLSLGCGIMIVYASYLPKKANITKNAIIILIINSGYSLFAGIGVFSVLGFMAASQGKHLSEVVSQSIGLAFVAYPKAISLMPGGNLFGAVFFFCLVVAGLSSSISIIEASVSAIIDKFGFRRSRVVTIISLTGFIAATVFTTRAGLLWIDIVDHFLTHYGLILVGIAECIFVGWFFKITILRKHVNAISSIKIGRWWDILIKYFIPFILGAICIGDVYNEIQKPYGGYSWTVVIMIGTGWILITLIGAFVLTSRKWKINKEKKQISR